MLPAPEDDRKDDGDAGQEDQDEVPELPRPRRLMARTRAGSPESRRLLSPRAVRPVRAYSRYRNIPGRQLSQNEGVRNRLEGLGDRWAKCTVMPMATTEQKRFPTWYNVCSSEGEETSV